jgi:hypothetical protein
MKLNDSLRVMGDSPVTLYEPTTGADGLLPVTLPNWWGMVKDVFDGQGVPVDIWLSILYAESGGNPNAGNYNGESSIGLFQLNQNGGQGAGYTAAQLRDPLINASVAVTAIAKAYRVYGDDVAAVAAHSGHPGYDDRLVNDPRVLTIVRYYDLIKGQATPQGKWAALTGGSTDVGPLAPSLPPDSIGGTGGTGGARVVPATGALDVGGQLVDAIKGELGRNLAPILFTVIAIMLIGVGLIKLADSSPTLRAVATATE